MQSLFTDDAVVAGSLGMSSASEYVPKLIAGASEYAATQHNITNQYVARAADDPADLVVHSYAVALHFDDATAPTSRWASSTATVPAAPTAAG